MVTLGMRFPTKPIHAEFRQRRGVKNLICARSIIFHLFAIIFILFYKVNVFPLDEYGFAGLVSLEI